MKEMAMSMTCPEMSGNYTTEQVTQLIGLKDQTIRWLKDDRKSLEMRVTELQNRIAKVNQALTLIQQLSNKGKDLAMFEMMKL